MKDVYHIIYLLVSALSAIRSGISKIEAQRVTQDDETAGKGEEADLNLKMFQTRARREPRRLAIS